MKYIGISVLVIVVAGLFLFVWQRDMESTTPEQPYGDLIRVTYPEVGDAISSPLVVKGEARGGWYFEATFPIVVVDWDGRIIGEGYATAQDDWMSEDFVPFEGSITFDADTSVSDRGAVIFRNSNASGLPEHDKAVEISVTLVE